MVESKVLHLQRIQSEKAEMLDKADKLRASLRGFCTNYGIDESLFCGDGRKVIDLSLSDLIKATNLILKIAE